MHEQYAKKYRVATFMEFFAWELLSTFQSPAVSDIKVEFSFGNGTINERMGGDTRFLVLYILALAHMYYNIASFVLF